MTEDDERVEMEYSDLKQAIVDGDPDAFRAELERANEAGTLDTDEDLLHTAATFGEVEMARALVEAGVPLDERDHEGKTPLHLALETGSDEVATLLVEQGADPNAADDHGNGPLWRAVFDGNVSMAESLVEAGADPDHANDAGKSPRDLAEEYDVAELLSALQTD